MEDGLPHNNVEAIAQTPDGYLWLGTQNGLARFDGRRSWCFHTNTPALKDPYIRASRRTQDGALADWHGNRWPAAAQRRALHDHGATRKRSSAQCDLLGRTADGTLSLAGTTTGLFARKGEAWTQYTRKDELLHDLVRSMCEFQNQLWIATERGLNVLKDGILTTNLTAAGDFPLRYVRTVCPDRSGRLWLGGRNGLGCLQNGQFTFYTKRDGLPDENETVLLNDTQGTLWIGSMGGLNHLSGCVLQ